MHTSVAMGERGNKRTRGRGGVGLRRAHGQSFEKARECAHVLPARKQAGAEAQQKQPRCHGNQTRGRRALSPHEGAGDTNRNIHAHTHGPTAEGRAGAGEEDNGEMGSQQKLRRGLVMSTVSVLAGLVTRTWAVPTAEGVKQITLTHHTITGAPRAPAPYAQARVACIACDATTRRVSPPAPLTLPPLLLAAPLQAHVRFPLTPGTCRGLRAQTRRWAGRPSSRSRCVCVR